MPTQTDLARLQSELDDPFTPLLLALADWHEETDQPAMARAYRRIAAEGKVPDIVTDGWRLVLADDANPERRYSLRWSVWDRASRLAGPRTNLGIAYHALALAYAELEKESASG